ncbi:MAG: recombination protein O N-terminal domain-containing protein [Treponema sp.]|jgi:DNA repair protein RecO (recombination protein O)|nr:recombination protein O N-terminal domain-containing protein [Treponema sp.]
MERHHIYSALVLKVRPSGESNREAFFLTQEAGILRATVFGGPKSKFRALVSPFHQGRLWVYHNPVRDSRKLTDFDVQSWRFGIREHYQRVMTAGAILELVLESQGSGGNWARAWDLANRTLDALDHADAGTCIRIFIHFLWTWTCLLGLRPDIHHCASCTCEAPVDGLLLWNDREGTLYCPSCAGVSPEKPGSLGLGEWVAFGPGVRRWLGAVENQDPEVVGRYTLDLPSLSQAKALVTRIMARALGKRLPGWDRV